MSGRRSAALIALLLGVTALVAWGVYLDRGATGYFEWQIEFAALPPDDSALQEWLGGQPGVAGAVVRREGNTVTAGCEVYLLRGATVPDVPGKMEELGYRGPKGVRSRGGR